MVGCKNWPLPIQPLRILVLTPNQIKPRNDTLLVDICEIHVLNHLTRCHHVWASSSTHTVGAKGIKSACFSGNNMVAMVAFAGRAASLFEGKRHSRSF